MTIEECYRQLGGSYCQVCARLPGKQFVERFFARYLEDDSAERLHAAVQAGSAEEALRLAIGLKGLSGNLGFGKLERACGELVKLLYEGRGVLTQECLIQEEAVRRCHRETAEILQRYLVENGR